MESIWPNDLDAIRIMANNRRGYYVAKRILDNLVALLVLVFLSPLLVFIAIAILIYSPLVVLSIKGVH